MSPQPNLKLAILALGLGAFAIGTSEFAAMGLLPWYANDLGITEPQAGHVVSAYALGGVVGAPITSILGARLPRRRYLAALIAVNLAVMNLLPLPALDGGKIFFLVVNVLCMLTIRRKIPEKYENYIHLVGFILLMALMAAITFQDVWKIFQ